MKKITIFVFVLAVLVTLWGCNENEKDSPVSGVEAGAGQARVRFSIGGINYSDGVETRGGSRTGEPETVLIPLVDGENLLECTLTRDPQTRATEILMAEGTAVRVFVYEGGTHVKDSIIHVGSTSDAMVLDAGKTYTIRAVSYNLKNDGSDIATVMGHPSLSGSVLTGISPGHDLLYAEETLTTIPGVNNKELILNHKFSRIKVTANSSQMGANITACSATLTPGKTASLSLNTGTLTQTTPDVTQNLTWPTGLPGQNVTSKDTTVYTGNAATLTLVFSITVGTPYTKNVTFAGPLAAGNRYTVTVNFKKIPSVTIGTSTWTKANLYRTATYYGLYANEYDYGGGTMSGGGYWNWGTTRPWDDYTSYYNDSNHGPYPSNWNVPANDPCFQALGAGWHLPTKTEFDNLTDYTVRGNYSTSTRVYGLWCCPTRKTLAAAQQSAQSNVFLPYALMRDRGGTRIITAWGSSYWTKTRVSQHNSECYAFCFSNIDGSALQFQNYPQSYGCTIRCVKN